MWDSQLVIQDIAISSFQTFACNSASVVARDRVCSVDLGYQMKDHEKVVTAAGSDFDSGERELGLLGEKNDIFFDTNNDEYDDNLHDNDDIYLL